MRTQIFTLLSFLLLALVANGQDLTVDPKISDASFLNADLNDNELDLASYITVANKTSEVMEIKWIRIVPSDCPEQWQTQVCDNNLCYFYTVYSNIDASVGLDEPFVLQPNEEFHEFAMHVWPRQTPGCCQLKVQFATVAEPDVIMETAYFNVSINQTGCFFPTSAEEKLEAESVSIYPNPTTGQFTLTNNDVVKKVVVFNILGKRMKSFAFQNGDNLDISDLANGLYLVSMQNAQGETLKTMRVSKRGFQP